jgi:hypothetical protein
MAQRLGDFDHGVRGIIMGLAPFTKKRPSAIDGDGRRLKRIESYQSVRVLWNLVIRAKWDRRRNYLEI